MRTILLLFLSLSLFLLLQLPVYSQKPNFVLNGKIGIQVDSPEDVAVDNNGYVYFVSGAGTVTRFNYHESLGTEHIEYAPEGLSKENYGTYDIALDRHDNLFVVSYTYSKVAKFDPEGKLLLQFGSIGEGPGQFRFPEGIAVNSKDEVYVADSGNKRIQKFDKTGKLLQTIPLDATTGNYFEAPLSIDFDKEDNLFVLHNPENKIVKYSPAGKKLLEFGHETTDTVKLETPWKLAVDKESGEIFISDETYEAFNIYNSDGTLEYSIKYVSGGYQHRKGYKNSIAVTPQGDIILANRGRQGDGQIYLHGRGLERFYTWGNLWQNQDLTIDEEANVYLLDVTGKITKFNSAGELVMTFGERGSWSANFPNIVIDFPRAITSDPSNNIYALSSAKDSPPKVVKTDQTGGLLKEFTDFGAGASNNEYTDLAVDGMGNMYVADYTGGVIRKIDSHGRYVGSIGSPGFGPGQIWLPLAVAIDRVGIVHVLDYNGGRVQQFDPSGKFIRQFGKFSKNDGTAAPNSDMALDGKGNVHVTSNMHQSRYWIFSSRGKLLHEELDRKINHIALDKSGQIMVIDDDQADAYSYYYLQSSDTDTPRQGSISGYVYADQNQNCTYDAGEKGLPGVVIMATPGQHYAITGEDGSYTLDIELGDYTLHTIIPLEVGRTITPTCPLPDKGLPITVSTPGQRINNANFANTVYSPPHLIVSVSSDRRRRCFESVTKVRYANTGFAPAENAKVYLKLPPEVELLSADKPYTRLADGTYEFAIGTVGGNNSGTITIQDKVTCGNESVRGRTVCTRAWITPPNNAPTEPIPTITITGQCNYDLGMVRFVLKNTGQADMTDPKLFRKYIDGDLSSIEQYRLAAGDSMVLWVPTSGMTVRLEAEQPEGNGDNTLASVTVEACRVSATQTGFSTGIVNLMPADEEEAEVSEECLLITDSFDPNDKLVTPVGRTAENYTPTNTALKYKIRFQNTGTDVAYRVVVVDTLSEHLDLSTLQVGAASHTHRFEVSGKGRPVLTWTFDNIMLPDSTADEPNSHGYIQFSIKPKADLPEKTAVENFADIFFDYNSPVRTNVTVNRIYDMPPVINEAVRMDLEDILATPGITGFAPAAGRYGTEVVLSGKKFSGIAARNKVYFNNKPAQVLSASATELRVLVPDGAATGSIKVVTSDGAASTTEQFQVYQPPVITSFSPAEGMVGQTVTLQGNHLDTELIESIKLGTLVCEIVSNAAGTLVVKVPANAVTAKFEIVTKGGEALTPSSYVVWYQPAIHSLSKQTDIVGATITISGQNFASDPARNKVHFDGVQAQVLQTTPDMLTVKVPAGAESGFITVETPGGKASSTLFEVIPGPKFTAMLPVKGSVGTEVEITGIHFLTMGQQDEIRFNGEKALVLEASTDRLKVRVPRGATTGKVQITGFGGIAYSTTDFEIEELAPAEAILVYPNPTTGYFIVSLQHADFDVQAVEVYDAVGKLVHTTKVAGPRPEKQEMNIRLSRSGIYTLHFKTDRGTVIKKLTVL